MFHQVILEESESKLIFQINQPPRCNNFSSLLLDVYLQRSHAHHQELNNCSSSLWFYLRIVVIAVLLFVVGPAGLSSST
jgi:hypothetical protein